MYSIGISTSGMHLKEGALMSAKSFIKRDLDFSWRVFFQVGKITGMD
jgi:hypothetical protein